MPDLAKINHELSQELYKHVVYWGIDKKDKKLLVL